MSQSTVEPKYRCIAEDTVTQYMAFLKISSLVSSRVYRKLLQNQWIFNSKYTSGLCVSSYLLNKIELKYTRTVPNIKTGNYIINSSERVNTPER